MKRTLAYTSALIAAGSIASGAALAQSQFSFDDNEYDVMATVLEISPDGTMYGLSNGTMIRDDAAYYSITGDLMVGDAVELRFDENNALIAVVPAS